MKSSRFACLVSMFLAGAVALGACGGETPPPAAPKTPTPPATSAPAASAEPEPAKPPEPKYDVDFVEAKQSQPPAKLPRVSIDVPGYNQFIPASLVSATKVRYKVGNWGDMPEGAYLQFVLDGKPFRPVKDPSEAIMLQDIAGGELSEGEHIIAAFVNRANHESVKGERAVAVRRFWTGKRTPGGWDSNRDAIMILGSPHGTIDGSDVIIDWYVLNALISDKEYSVRVKLEGPGIKAEGIQRVITEWKPWIMLSAHDGEYTINTQLLDANGDVVPGALNDLTRKFTVKH